MCVRRVFWCGVLLHIATCQPPLLPRVRVAPYSQVTKLSSETYLLPATTTSIIYQPKAGPGAKTKSGDEQQTVGSSVQKQEDNKRNSGQRPKLMWV